MTEEQFLKLKENPSWVELSCKVCDECYLAYTQVQETLFQFYFAIRACATANDLKANAQQIQYKDSILKKHKELLKSADIFKENEEQQKIGLLFSNKGFVSDSHTSLLSKKQFRKSNFLEGKIQNMNPIEEQKQKEKVKQLPNISKPSFILNNNNIQLDFEEAGIENKNETETKQEQIKGLSLEEFINKEKNGRKHQFLELQKQTPSTTKNEVSKKVVNSFFAKPNYKSDPKAIYFNPITPQCKLPKINKIDNSDALSSSTNTSAKSKPTFEFMLTTIKDLKSHLVDLQ